MGPARVPSTGHLPGAPTGTTLLARAVAGEAGVPFFSLSASEFVEIIVGVGADLGPLDLVTYRPPVFRLRLPTPDPAPDEE